MRRSLTLGFLTSLLLAGSAASAVAGTNATAGIGGFDWYANGVSEGFESRTWYAATSGTSSTTLYTCKSVYSGGRVGLTEYRDVSLAPDPAIGTISWACDNNPYNHAWPSTSAGTYYWSVAYTPGGCISTPNTQCPTDLTGRTAYPN
jgi:hypothetical protein